MRQLKGGRDHDDDDDDDDVEKGMDAEMKACEECRSSRRNQWGQSKILGSKHSMLTAVMMTRTNAKLTAAAPWIQSGFSTSRLLSVESTIFSDSIREGATQAALFVEATFGWWPFHWLMTIPLVGDHSRHSQVTPNNLIPTTIATPTLRLENIFTAWCYGCAFKNISVARSNSFKWSFTTW